MFSHVTVLNCGKCWLSTENEKLGHHLLIHMSSRKKSGSSWTPFRCNGSPLVTTISPQTTNEPIIKGNAFLDRWLLLAEITSKSKKSIFGIEFSLQGRDNLYLPWGFALYDHFLSRLLSWMMRHMTSIYCFHHSCLKNYVA